MAVVIHTIAFVVFCVGMLIGIGPLPFGRAGEPSALAYIFMLGLAPLIGAFGAALPARALGAGWPRSLLASAAAVAAFFLSLSAGSATLTVAVFALAPTAVTLVASAGSDMAMRGLVAVLAASTVPLAIALSGVVVGSMAVLAIGGALGWVTVPMTAGLFIPDANGQVRD